MTAKVALRFFRDMLPFALRQLHDEAPEAPGWDSRIASWPRGSAVGLSSGLTPRVPSGSKIP